ncbi:acetylornithine/succinylornithine family transaminase [Clostridium sp. NSJ-6]|uniref:Acetylornithine/succinylornithine family transaminase n=1 Tax=Clostridium hominis TaxID=2763036 RepID=A0ABR7D7I6_9CLOT|nr:acetylornithine/succinylornithine family transaminase [Clostridium hominis]MBC5627347.1 acetylornithine/succinylornithine family transaminase [Clostridium hominis]MDU2672400.1 acetylornithine/succinylornithine family transaminase [Clostridium sp.]
MGSLHENDKKYILNLYNRLNLEVERAEGVYLYDKDNNKYLDMYSGISVNNLGYDKGIAKAIKNQVDKYIHLSNYFVSEPTVNLAKLLVDNSFASKVYFSNSGTEANEGALKLCRKYGRSINEDKVEILSALNSFHGRTCGGLTLTGQEKYQKDFKPLLSGVNYFEFNNIESLRECVSENTCAVFLEVIQGEGGIVEVSQEFINEVVKLSKIYNFLIVIDEIQTGIGRSGDLFAFEKYNFTPDVVTLAKSIGGGLPLGAILVSERLEEVLKIGDHGSTFGGNPVACAAGEFVLDKVVNTNLLDEVREKSKYILDELQKLKKDFPTLIKEIRGRGMMIGVDVGESAIAIRDNAMNNNLLLNVTNKTVIRLLPPLCISYNEINEFLEKFRDILSKI